MLVTFRTETYPPITMFDEVAQKLLEIMGVSGDIPGAIKGHDVGKALARLRSGLARLEQESDSLRTDSADEEEPAVNLTVRAFPLLELMSLANENGSHVMWTKASGH